MWPWLLRRDRERFTLWEDNRFATSAGMSHAWPVKYGPTSHQQFRSRAVKYHPRSLLPVLAERSWTLDWKMPPGAAELRYPWLLSEAARECLDQDAYRGILLPAPSAFMDDLLETGFNLWESGLDADDIQQAIYDMGTRRSFQQFFFASHQPLAELGRLAGAFEGGDPYYQSLNMKGISEQTIIDVLDMPLDTFVRTALLINFLAGSTKGQIRLSQIDKGAVEAVGISFENFASVLTEFMAGELDELRRRAGEDRNTEPALRNLDLNPLMDKPYVHLEGDWYVAPVKAFASNRIGTVALKFKARDRLDSRRYDQFSSDLGTLIEKYVGRQLRQIPSAAVHEERKHGDRKGKQGDTCDWILVVGGITVIIEVKLGSIKHAAKLSFNEFIKVVKRDIGKALGTQIPVTADLIRNGDKAFADLHFPKTLYGIVVTLDKYYTANSELVREKLKDAGLEPGLPYAVLSLQELEFFVASVLAGADPVELITRFCTGNEIPQNDMSRYCQENGLEPGPDPLINRHFESVIQGYQVASEARLRTKGPDSTTAA